MTDYLLKVIVGLLVAIFLRVGGAEKALQEIKRDLKHNGYQTWQGKQSKCDGEHFDSINHR